MITSDNLHASIAGALVNANISFSTLVEKTPENKDARTYRLPYSIRGHDCVVTGYVGGATLTVLAAIRLEGSANEFAAKRHAFADFLMTKLPLVRLFADLHAAPADLNVVWVEAAVPVPPNGLPIEPWLAVTPFAAVASAVEVLASTFPDQLKPSNAASFPLLVAERSERPPSTVPPA